jgi:deoxyribodipyrimidine photolyase-related protein
MSKHSLILILGDQLTHGRGALKNVRPADATVVMAEVREEAMYVRHSRHKIALIFSAMRHFRDKLRESGFEVIYFDYEAGISSLTEALERALEAQPYDRLSCCEPGEYRVREVLDDWAGRRGVDLDWCADDRFLCSLATFRDWAEGRKQLRMEYFYREV